ncbi:DUF6781 family protein [Azoarcus sp. KH32C]|uniref:DUF6781 family protein n=1 Tax=Azoarcus sp. KH32C TaxID=748247 RepID=UPI0002386EE6|nr:DUF6781 family protein [Azoarcus sp. KH32C]BAL24977.1 hypothetical protein AZKH_2671 [Azoarcus sp. KH32C]
MSQSTEGIERDVHAAVDADTASVADRVRTITLKALSEGRLDSAALKEVTSAVLRGAQQGIERPDRERTEAMRQAVRGLDEALAAAAQATVLAMQEAIGRGSEFSKQELRGTLDQIGAMESNFLNTLADAGRAANGLARTTLHELAEHARHSGTQIGSRVAAASAELTRALAALTRDQVQTGARTVRNEAGLLAALASGMLRGIADRLDPSKSHDRKPPATPSAPPDL